MIFEHREPLLEFEHKYDEHFENLKMHMHTTIELYYFISGDCRFHIEGNVYKLEPGDILVMKPAESHFADVKSEIPYERMVFNFDENIFSGIDGNSSLLKPITERKSGQNNLYRSFKAREILNDLYTEYKEPLFGELARPVIYSKLLSVLIKISELYCESYPDDHQKDTEIYNIIRYINNNLCETLDLDTISKRFFISKSQLCLLFKRSTGSGLWKYITTKRLLAAKKEIDLGEKPTVVYQKYGFKDYSAFYRAFIKQFGHSPQNNGNQGR